MAAVGLTGRTRSAFDVWTEEGPSDAAIETAIADYESKIAWLRWLRAWRERYWPRRHQDLREAALAQRRRMLAQQSAAERLYEFAERLTGPVTPLRLTRGAHERPAPGRGGGRPRSGRSSPVTGSGARHSLVGRKLR